MDKNTSLADSPGKFLKILFTILRITIGWHFLFEGIFKLAHGPEKKLVCLNLHL